jgi:uncharacterized membrane protein HdeD (DUF308 family)
MIETVRKNRTWFILEGILFILLGLVGIIVPAVLTITVELFIGWLFVFGGLIKGYRTFTTYSESGFWVSLISALFFLVIGVLLLAFPLSGVLSLTMLLAIFFLAEGIAQIIMGFQLTDAPKWGWLVVSGVISLIMGGIILSGWPSTAAWVIGLIVGINLLFLGISILSVAIPSKYEN